MSTQKCQPLTSGLASVGVYARGKFCGNLKVYRPSEHLRSPARTPSRQPLAASDESVVEKCSCSEKELYLESVVE